MVGGAGLLLSPVPMGRVFPEIGYFLLFYFEVIYLMYDFKTNLFEYILGYSAEEWQSLNNYLKGGENNGKETQS
jgi:hypothetical protein